MRNGSLARPGAAVRIRTGRGLRAFIVVSLETSLGVLPWANVSDVELLRGIFYPILTQVNNSGSHDRVGSAHWRPII